MVGRGAILAFALVLSVSAYDNVQFFGHDATTSEGVMKQQTMSFHADSTPNGNILDDMTDHLFSTFVMPANATVEFPVEFWEGDALFLNVHVANPDDRVSMKLYHDNMQLAGFSVPADTATSYELPISLDNITMPGTFTFETYGFFSGYVYFSAVAKVYTPGTWDNDDGVIVIDLYNEDEALIDLSIDVLRQSPDFGDDTVGLDSLYISASADLIMFNYNYLSQYFDHMNVPVMMLDTWGFLADGYSLSVQVCDPDLLVLTNPAIGSYFEYGSTDGITQALQTQIQLPVTQNMHGINISVASAWAPGTALSRYVRLTDGASGNNALLSSVFVDGAGYVSYVAEASSDVDFTNSQGDDAPLCKNALYSIEFFTYAELRNDTEQVALCSEKNETWVAFGIPDDVGMYANPWIEFDLHAIYLNGDVEFNLLLVDDSVNSTADINDMNSMWLQNYTVGVRNDLTGGRHTIRIPMAYMDEQFTAIVFTRYNPPDSNKFQFLMGTVAQFYDSPKASATPTTSMTGTSSASASQSASSAVTPTQTSSMSAAVTPTASMSAAMTPSMTGSVSAAAASGDDDDDAAAVEEVVVTKVEFSFSGNDVTPATLTSDGVVNAIKSVMATTLMVPADNVEVQEVRLVTKKQTRLEATIAIRETADVDATAIANSVENVDEAALVSDLNTAFQEEGVDIEILELQVTETTIDTTSAGFAVPTLAALLAALFASVAFN